MSTEENQDIDRLIVIRLEENKGVKYPNIDKFPENIARMIRTLDQRTGMILCSGEIIKNDEWIKLRVITPFGKFIRSLTYNNTNPECLAVGYNFVPGDQFLVNFYENGDLGAYQWLIEEDDIELKKNIEWFVELKGKAY